MERTFTDCHSAIAAGNGKGLTCIGWNQAQALWTLYSPKEGAPKGITPEFFCIGTGRLPVPLSEDGFTIFEQLLESFTEKLPNKKWWD